MPREARYSTKRSYRPSGLSRSATVVRPPYRRQPQAPARSQLPPWLTTMIAPVPSDMAASMRCLRSRSNDSMTRSGDHVGSRKASHQYRM